MNTQLLADQIKALVDACDVSKYARRAGLRAITAFERLPSLDMERMNEVLPAAPFTVADDGTVSRKPGVDDMEFINGVITALDAYYLLVDPPLSQDYYTIYQAAAYLHVARISLKKSIERTGKPDFQRSRSRDLIFTKASLDEWNEARKPAGNPNWVLNEAE